MTYFISAVVLLGLVIFIHELGHFLFAKLSGVKVEKFSLGFGPALFKRQYGETEYRISVLPLGGYVKMLGEEAGGAEGEKKSELTEEEKERAFNRQPIWKRALIVFAGPMFNMIFAAFLFGALMAAGVPILQPEIGAVRPDSPAMGAGLINGDMIIAVNGIEVAEWNEVTEMIHTSAGRKLVLDINRAGERLKVSVVPRAEKHKNLIGDDIEVGIIGIAPSGKSFTKKFGFVGSVTGGIEKTYEATALTLDVILRLVTGRVSSDNIGGPIFIVQMSGMAAKTGLGSFVMFMAFINVNLGVLNLFPVPLLDGGLLCFFAAEAVRGKPLSEKTVEISYRVGLALLILLMVFAFYNDIMRLITGRMMF